MSSLEPEPLTHLRQESYKGLARSLLTTKQIEQKCRDSRRSHANNSVLKHHRDPSVTIYSIRDLERLGWVIATMYDSFQDFMLGRCLGGCQRYALELDRREISIDIIDPFEPPVWGVNTQWMCLPDNSRKATKTHAQRIAERIQQLTQPTLPTATPKSCPGQASLW